MKKFKEYTPAIDSIKVKKLKEIDYIDMVGGEENYKLMKEYKLINEEFSFDDATNFMGNLIGGAGSLGSTIGKNLTIEIIAKFMKPMFTSMGLDEKGLLFYMLCRGTIYTVDELGVMAILDSSKQKDFCRAFSVGSSKAINDWVTFNGMANLFTIFGINKADTVMKRTIITSLRDVILPNGTDNGKVTSMMEKFICETTFDINGTKTSLWGHLTSFFKNNYTKLIGL
jgi:hypothetical protein